MRFTDRVLSLHPAIVSVVFLATFFFPQLPVETVAAAPFAFSIGLAVVLAPLCFGTAACIEQPPTAPRHLSDIAANVWLGFG